MTLKTKLDDLTKKDIDRPAHRHRANAISFAKLRFRRKSVTRTEHAGRDLLAQDAGQLGVGRFV